MDSSVSLGLMNKAAPLLALLLTGPFGGTIEMASRIQDAFMRDKGIDYFENSRRATHVQQQYAIHNPHAFVGYGQYFWGLTASDGPGRMDRQIARVKRRFFDYVARGVPDGPDDGTVAPWAVAASLPFAPEIVLPTVRYFKEVPTAGYEESAKHENENKDSEPGIAQED